MKSKDKKALQGKTMAELVAFLKEKREQLIKVKMEAGTNKIKNIHAGAQIRGEIAIIETIKRTRELAKDEVKNG
ncbi:50S ribosomal protein L29 [Candidatus Microgenomates bacterium]|nr:50S ribosomal protein L29 [Candidatus Microgenomates bacterium]